MPMSAVLGRLGRLGRLGLGRLGHLGRLGRLGHLGRLGRLGIISISVVNKTLDWPKISIFVNLAITKILQSNLILTSYENLQRNVNSNTTNLS